jgi:Glycosyltransferase family 87
VALALAAAALVYSVLLLKSLGTRSNALDFSNFYLSARILARGLDPYTTDLRPLAASLNMDVGNFSRFDYPPTFILMFEPLALLTPKHAHQLYTGFNILVFVLILYMLLGNAQVLMSWSRMSLASLLILFYPVEENFHFAQTQVLILFLLLLVLRFARRGEDARAGAVLAVACLLKLYPLIMLGYFLVWRRWRTVIYAVISLISGIIITAALLRERDLAESVTRIVGNHLRSVGPLSVSGLVSHAFSLTMDGRLGVFTAPVEHVLRALAGPALLGVTVLGTVKAPRDRLSEEHTFGLWLIAAVTVGPPGWANYMVFFLPTFVQLASAIEIRTASTVATWCGIGAYAWANVAGLGVSYFPVIHRALGRAVTSTNVYGMFFPCGILGFVTAYLLTTQLQPGGQQIYRSEIMM